MSQTAIRLSETTPNGVATSRVPASLWRAFRPQIMLIREGRQVLASAWEGDAPGDAPLASIAAVDTGTRGSTR